ncbi:hypothetical protein [Kitasatospora sp. NPDC091276]|uniref:hypothetical protein n=1 Tax=Kitasatospora sp. NPDC091276 TaxID=3155300 RepID=UPI003432C9D9
MQVGDYVEEWKAHQRDLSPASLRHLESLLEHHLHPAFHSRRMDTFDHKAVEAFTLLASLTGLLRPQD